MGFFIEIAKTMKQVFVILPVFFFVVLQSCGSGRELAYVSDAERDSAQAILTSYITTIHPGDQLYIYVYSQTPESVIPFNQETHILATEINRLFYVDTSHIGVRQVQETAKQDYRNLSTSVTSVPGYLVDEGGAIIFPILGKMTVAGITQDSLAHLIERNLIEGEYLKDPVVTVTPMNFRVSVVGEVARPQEIHITGDRLTILEALAMCGDLTIYGQRENITVVRSKKGEATPITVDLTKKTLFDSEAYYLQPNDIVYVEPNKQKKRSSQVDENWPRYVSFGVSLASAILIIGHANMGRWRRL